MSLYTYLGLEQGNFIIQLPYFFALFSINNVLNCLFFRFELYNINFSQ